MRRKRLRHAADTISQVFCGCLLLGAAITSTGCSRLENLSKCRSGEPDTRIAGCAALIQGGQYTTGNLSTIYGNRGTAYSSKGDHDHAIQDFNEAIRLNPNNFRAYYDRGQAYNREDDFDLAIPDFSEAIRLNPNDMSGYYSRGSAYYNKGDYDRAIQDYSEAILLNPNFALTYEKRGDAYLVQSNLTAAIANFEQAISAAPSSRTAVVAALMLHVAMKRQGLDDAQQLAPVAAAADLSKWPGPALKLDLGQMTAGEVMVAAAHADADMQKWQFARRTTSPARTHCYIINKRRRWRASRPRAMPARRATRITARLWPN
jgi:tetratricopeptide (TPR) repeat protein